jgi:hypothetical protein
MSDPYMTKTDKLRSAEEIRTLGLLLIDGFSLMSYASVILSLVPHFS